MLVRIDRADSMWQVGEIVHVPTWVDRRSGHIVTPALGEQAEASRHVRRLRTAAARAAATLGASSTGLSPSDAIRWIREVVPNRWQLSPMPPSTVSVALGEESVQACRVGFKENILEWGR